MNSKVVIVIELGLQYTIRLVPHGFALSPIVRGLAMFNNAQPIIITCHCDYTQVQYLFIIYIIIIVSKCQVNW